MSKSKGFFSICVPSATVFISSFCIMVLELVASRLIARYLGSSLYTWTAVIGVVLAGITIGNYLGGRIADRYQARKALASLFAISSATCVLTIIANNLIGEWIWLWQFSWPARTFIHVSLVFLLPAVLLGTISPVVAKMALDKNLATGRTVGDIYAWGAAGSIAGTFVAGYYLISVIGTIAIIWTVGAILLLMAILYWMKFWPLYVWAMVFLLAMTMGTIPAKWAEDKGSLLALREKPNPDILYKDESQYCYIAVKRLSEKPDKRAFMQDKLMHSTIIMENVLDLQYSYEQIHAAVTHLLSRDKKKLSVLIIGGGGYVFPRYVEKVWPGSRIDVAEIDPAVTKAAMNAFGLERDTTINTFTEDARNYINQLLELERTKGQKTRYDFIYEDALNDYSIPYQLTTKELNDKIAKILTDSGVYMIEIIDIYDSSLFLGAFLNTLEQTFPHVYVISEKKPRSTRNTFVIIAAKQEINLEKLNSEEQTRNLNLWILNDSDIEIVKQKANEMILTDDYAPVENLLAPVVRKSSRDFLATNHLENAEKLKQQGKLEEAIIEYMKSVKTDHTMSIKAYNDIALILARQGKLEEAVQYLRKALDYNEKADFQDNTANIHYSSATALKRLGRLQEASAEYDIAVKEFHKLIAQKPYSLNALINLGDLLAENGRFAEAAPYFQRAVNLNPMMLPNHFKLIQALEYAGQLDPAIQAARESIEFFSRYKQKGTAAQLQQYLELLEFKKSKSQK